MIIYMYAQVYHKGVGKKGALIALGNLHPLVIFHFTVVLPGKEALQGCHQRQ